MNLENTFYRYNTQKTFFSNLVETVTFGDKFGYDVFLTESIPAKASAPQNITYTSFNKMLSIMQGNKSHLLYGVNNQRIKGTFKTSGTTKLTRYYMGNYEEEINATGNVRKLHYINGGNGLVAIMVRNGGVDSLYYTYCDYQGNLLAVTDAAGNIKERYAYDPWGQRVNPANWMQKDTRTSFLFSCGYTLHEHIDEFGLINMNARLYDPTLGRFISIDPYVQAPDFSQSFNRYSYALNNPLSFTDPSGEFWWMIPVIIGAYIGGSAANDNFNPAKWDYSNWQTYAGIAVGGLAGYAGAAVGASIAASAVAGGASTFGAGIAGGMMGGMASGGINGFGMSLVMGGNLNDALGNGIQGAVMGGFSGALSGGVGAAIGDFSGVTGGAFKNAMYELGHSALKGAATGLAGGAMMAAMTQDASYLWKGAAMGAAFGTGMAGLRIAAMGPTFIPDPEIYCELPNYGQVYRRGSIFMPRGTGITLGNNAVVKLTGNTDYNRFLIHHETGHITQIAEMGMARFYGRTLSEYAKYGLGNVYDIPGTLEFTTDYYAYSKLGYMIRYDGSRFYYKYSFPWF